MKPVVAGKRKKPKDADSATVATRKKNAGATGRTVKYSSDRYDVAVVGLGYVGLPLCVAFARKGLRVLGFDIDATKVERLNAGASYIRHIGKKDVLAVLDGGGRATAEPADLSRADAILICVPTPLTKNREPDMRFVRATGEMLAGVVRKGQLIVLESTTYPGTTREVLLPALEASGLKAGRDFNLAYSPEREDPGSAGHSAPEIPKVVGGLTRRCLERAERLYGAVVPRTVPVSSLEAAEATKLMENIFRCVNIALVNELKLVFDRMGIDIWEVV
ncbi:MAG: nucleotide sugar dehydrogenase, partial [Planctomycetes bacterium]|nr:nucleotide sugar dehydrogenase [Planctomycetota bacterium]